MKPWLTFLACWFLALSASAQMSPPRMVNPATYRSPTGQFLLEVDPTDFYGRGESQCRLTAGGREVWAKKLPFTFSETALTEDGVVAGYGYTEALYGWARQRDGGRGDLRIAILNPDGSFRCDEKLPRVDSRMMHAVPVPTASGLLLHPEARRFTVWLENDQESWWQVYDLASGARLKRFKVTPEGPESGNAHGMTGARAIAGLPLTLIEWWTYDDKTRRGGPLFTLVDLDGKQVWQMARPGSYSVPGDEKAEDKLRSQMEETGALLPTSQTAAFELWYPREKKRGLFSVTTGVDGWQVKEMEQRPYEPPAEPEEKMPAVPDRPLPKLGEFVLGGQPPLSAARNASRWSIDDQGRFGLLRREAEKGTFVLLDPRGQTLAEIPLPPDLAGGDELAWVEGSRWVVIGTTPGATRKTAARWFDAKAKTQTAIEAFECPRVSSLAGTRDGGFVVLATEDARSTMTTFLIAFDEKGRRRWSIKGNTSLEPKDLFSPEAVTVTTCGEVAVVDNIRETVQFFDRKGKFLRLLDLEKAWGRKPSYPANIMADHEGGFVVYDSSAEIPFVWMKAEGTVREQFRPHYADGRAPEAHHGVRVAPDGTAWFYDGDALYPLQAEHVTGAPVGIPTAPAPALQSIASVAGDAHGHLFAVDRRTGVVHVFDQEGKPIRQCHPLPEDFDPEFSPGLTVAADGSAFVSGLNRRGRVQFDAEGGRVGVKPWPDLDSIGRIALPRNPTPGLLLLGYETSFLLDDAGSVVRRLERRADHQWLGHASGGAVAGDGSFAIISGPPALTFFSQSGEAVKTMALPPGYWWLDGLNATHAVLHTDRQIFLCCRDGTWAQCFTPPVNLRYRGSAEFLTHEGRELWITDFATRRVTRYAMPGE